MEPAKRTLSRRHAIRLLTVASGGIAVMGPAGCTPLRAGLRLYPRQFKVDDALVDATLAAFVRAVVMDESPIG